MQTQTNLDRFSQPGPSEKFKIKIVTLEPECEICGKHVHLKFIRKWNDKDACTQCIRELTREVSENDLI